MKIYDISQEVFSAQVYPGDPAPTRTRLCSMEEGEVYNLTAFSMCAHNGTHIDAPAHFLREGDTVEQIPLSRVVGQAFVVVHEGDVTAADARRMLEVAGNASPAAAKRLLIKGEATVTEEAAGVFATAGLVLLGNESQSVGPMEAPMAVHQCLLSVGAVLLEGIRLEEVPEGEYFLCAAPLCLGGAEGAPCRALLVDPTAPDGQS